MERPEARFPVDVVSGGKLFFVTVYYFCRCQGSGERATSPPEGSVIPLSFYEWSPPSFFPGVSCSGDVLYLLLQFDGG